MRTQIQEDAHLLAHANSPALDGSFESWRLRYQSNEQAMRAAYALASTLHERNMILQGVCTRLNTNVGKLNAALLPFANLFLPEDTGIYGQEHWQEPVSALPGDTDTQEFVLMYKDVRNARTLVYEQAWKGLSQRD